VARREGTGSWGAVGLLQVLFLALVLAINNFFGAVSLGAAELDHRARIRIVALFAAADCGLPLMGILLGAGLSKWLGPTASYLGAAVIMLTALYIFFDRGQEMPASGHAPLPRLLLTAIGLGLDNLGAGIGLGAMGFNLVLSLVAFGVVTAVVTVLGLLVGQFVFQRLAGRSVNGVSGTVLFVTGAAMLVSRIHSN